MQNSPARAALDVGSVIADTYTIEALVGRGGMGAVFLASHRRLPGKKVAIKVLHAELAGDEILARFRREAEIASRLGHPNIVAVHDFNLMPDGTPYLVLEYLEGESLAQRLRAGPMPLEQTLSIIRQIGSALAAAHREGIVHRDLKPQNIFLVPTEVDGRIVEIAKVLDFGISKIRGSQTVKTQDSALLGTPQYMAPEQATGQHSSVDERTDVFALGAIVYEMLAGHPAFDGASIPEVVFKVVYEQPRPLAQEVPSLPAPIAAAVQQAMAKSSAERFATVSAFVEALTGQPLTIARPPSLPPIDGSAPSGTKRSTGNEAYAQTMGSGDHGESRDAALARVGTATPPSADPIVRGSAPTVSSQGGTPPPKVEPQPVAAPPAQPSRTPLITAVVIAAAVAAGLVVYLVMSHEETRAEKHEAPAERHAPVLEAGNGPARHHAAEPAAQRVSGGAATTAPLGVMSGSAATPATPAATPAAPAQIADKAGKATTAGKPAKAGTANKTDKLGKTEQAKAEPATSDPINDAKKGLVSTDDAAGADERAAQLLREGDEALHAQQWTRAEQRANEVMASETATPTQKLRAHLLRGEVACAQSNEETARIDLRALRNAPRMRRHLLDRCHAAGQLRADE